MSDPIRVTVSNSVLSVGWFGSKCLSACVGSPWSLNSSRCCDAARLLGVRTGIIEQRVADEASWCWEQTDVAIIKKYTTYELNMKSRGSKNGAQWWLPYRTTTDELLGVKERVIGQLWWRETGDIKFCWALKKEDLGDSPKGPKRAPRTETAVANILWIHYAEAEGLWTQHVMSKCFKAFTPQQLSDEICKTEENLTELPKNIVLPQVFCFSLVFTGLLIHMELRMCLSIRSQEKPFLSLFFQRRRKVKLFTK